MPPRTIHIGKKDVRVWPSKQAIQVRGGPPLKSTHFTDAALYHPRLIDWLLSTFHSTKKNEYFFPGACGTKIRHIDQWPLPEARLIHHRALEMFRRVSGNKTALSDSSWGNIYRQNEYCMPHSHVRSMASIVYMLDPGNPQEEVDPHAGKLAITDPRMQLCCQDQADCMTTPFIPEMIPGTMLLFPGVVVHTVFPYNGDKPRITLAWNINDHQINQAHDWEK